MLKRPTFIPQIIDVTSKIPYSWPEKNPETVYISPDGRLENRIGKASPKSTLAFSCACAEWIAWNLEQAGTSRPLLELSEALWAAQVDWSYIRIAATLDRKDWRGAVKGPLYSAFSLLVDVASHAVEDEAETPEVVCLVKLSQHVFGSGDKTFASWRRSVLTRLADLYPRGPDQGPPVPREAMDPNFDYDPSMAPDLLSRFIASLDYRTNPYLRPPASMREKGFVGEPYRVA